MTIYKTAVMQRHMNTVLDRMPEEDRELVIRYLDHRTAIDGLSFLRISRIVQVLGRLRKEMKVGYTQATQADILELLAWMERADYSGWTKFTFRTILRQFLAWRGMDSKFIKVNRRIMRRQDALLYEPDVLKMIEICEHVRDKAILALLWEGGPRIGEVGNLRMKDVNFEHLGTRLRLFGKTGARAILLVMATPYILEWHKSHPNKGDSEAPFFVNIGKDKGSQMMHAAFFMTLRRLAKKAAIGKRVNPHWFRHSRATDLLKRWPEAQVRVFLGWDPESPMPGVYNHLAAQDSDDPILKDRGIVVGETSLPRLASIECPRCKYLNGIAEMLCSRCGMLLKLENQEKLKAQQEKELDERIKKMLENYLPKR